MHARVATFEGEDPAQMQKMLDAMSEGPPPEGVNATDWLVLVDRNAGKSVAIAFFESEEDLRDGDETLNSMSPPEWATGRRTSVELLEVAFDTWAGS